MKIQSTSPAKTFAHLPKSYAELVAWHLPRPLRDKADYENAVAIVDQLAGHDLN